MEIGNEIGQKIRSAIKAKLVDLGAYVDDELPDYIMVMVANKKTQTQMSDDLSLFLGSNTSKFTTWLHGLLEKLQSITTDSAITTLEQPSEVSVDIAVVQPLPPAYVPESKDVHDISSIKKTRDVVDGGLSIDAGVDEEADEEAPTVNKTTAAKKTTQKRSLTEVKPVVSTYEEPVIRIRLEHNEFEEESGSAYDGKVVVKSTAGRSSHNDKQQQQHHHHHHHHRATEGGHRRTRAETEEYVPEKYYPPTSSVSRPLVVANNTVPSRRRVTGLESLVGAMLKHDNEDNDEYDPCRPAIGNVASIIKVSDRKSSVPLSMQASKSLLLKAMQQAEQSVATIKKREVEDSLKRDDNRPSRRPLASVHRRLGIADVTTDPVEVRTIRSLPSMSSRAVSGVSEDARLLLDEAKEMRVSARVLKQRLSGRDLTDCLVDDNLADIEDTRRVHCSQSDDDSPEPKIRRSNGRSNLVARTRHLSEEMEVDRRRGSGRDEFEEAAEVDEEEDEEELRKILIEQKTQKMQLAVVTNPKFVVTLNSVYQLTAEESGGGDDDLQIIDVDDDLIIITPPHSPPVVDVPRNVVRVRPQFAQVPPTDANAAGLLGVGQPLAVMNENQKSSDRCRFWPVCKNGESCPFQHPTMTCKTFPSCRFGLKCLYIHPTCRFDGQCTKPSCPYTHVSPRSTFPSIKAIPKGSIFPMENYQKFGSSVKSVVPVIPAARASNVMKCKFFPNCTDMNCAFAHPMPCRYGVSCTSKSLCSYTHPLLPTKNQLKWTPAQQ